MNVKWLAALKRFAELARDEHHITDVMVKPEGLYVRMYADTCELHKADRVIAWTTLDMALDTHVEMQFRVVLDELRFRVDNSVRKATIYRG